jgi:uncharacterized protein DUF3168
VSLLDVWQDCWEDCWGDVWGAPTVVPPVIADLRPALRAFLLEDAGIAAAVGTRVFPTVLPQGVRGLSLVYRRISGLGDHYAQGPSGLTRDRYEIACWSPDMDQATAFGRLVKERLDGYRGPMASALGTVTVQGAMFDTSRHDYSGDVEMYAARAEYLIWYEAR